MASLPRKAWNIVAVHNIDDEDFVFEYDARSGNPPYVIPAGEVKRFPKFLAKHAIKHLVDKIMIKNNQRISNQEARRDLMEQIIVGEESFQPEPEKSEAEKTKEVVDRVNAPSEVDRILDKIKEGEKRAEKALKEKKPTKSGATPEDVETFAGLKKAKRTSDKPEKESPRPVPTRQEIYKYAEDVLKMTIDDKTRKKLDKMKVSELLKEVGDPRDSLV